MKTFVRVSEVWVPTADRSSLALSSGSYGALEPFREVSRVMRFGYGQGLPGKAWQSMKPVVLHSFEGSFFLRTEAARAAGLSTAVAIPFFDGDEIASVVVFFCGSDSDLVGAIEIWEDVDGSENELRLTEGFYGAASSFEWVSRAAAFRAGHGLPGLVWASGMPQIIPDLGRTSHFLRADAALRSGIEHGLGLPCGSDSSPAVVTMLSGSETPIARRIEIWVPAAGGDALRFHDGYCDLDPDFGADLALSSIASGAGSIGRAMSERVPQILVDPATEDSVVMSRAARVGLRSMLAMPILSEGRLVAVVTMYTHDVH